MSLSRSLYGRCLLLACSSEPAGDKKLQQNRLGGSWPHLSLGQFFIVACRNAQAIRQASFSTRLECRSVRFLDPVPGLNLFIRDHRSTHVTQGPLILLTGRPSTYEQKLRGTVHVGSLRIHRLFFHA
jgi:hypothetical protein